jgi:hypothetical protein
MTAPATICQEPGPGETRDCLDPWKLSFVHADGGVSLCCWSRAIGSIKTTPVNEILKGEAAQAMRRGLLTGRVPVDCVRCPSRSLVPLASLRRSVEDYLSADDSEARMKLRAKLYGAHEQLASLRKELVTLKEHRTNMEEHRTNMEEEREHLQKHIEILMERLNAIKEGRANILSLVRSWCRGRVRRALGRDTASTTD